MSLPCTTSSRCPTSIVSGIELPTLDMFYECDIEDETVLAANDDAAECMWIKPEDIHTEQFGLRSVRWGLVKFLEKNF